MKPLFDVAVSKKRVSSFTGCGACPMCSSGHTDFKNQIVGDGRKGVMLIMDCPEICEDDAGELWGVSDDKSSKYIETIKGLFSASDLDLDRDCWRINAVQCSPRHKHMDRLYGTVDLCRASVLKVIEEKKPKVIILFGSCAIKSIYGHRVKDKELTMDVNSWHGFAIPDHELGCWVLPCYGPSVLADNTKISKTTKRHVTKETYPLISKAIGRVLAAATRLSLKRVPDYFTKAKKCAFVLKTEAEILQQLKEIKSGDTVAIDYETSSIKPDYPNQFIKSAAIYSSNRGQAYSFVIDTRNPKLERVRTEWKRILTDSSIKKVGQNAKYEHRWTKARLGYWIKGWVWDTMLSSHTLFNARRGVTGLKFQTLVNFGIPHYTADVDSCFAMEVGNVGKGANVINGIDAVSPNELCLYNAFDTIFNFWIYERHVKAISKWENKLGDAGARSHVDGVKFLLDSSLTFAEMEDQGAYVDLAYLDKQREFCKTEITKLQEEFSKTKLYATWAKHFRPVQLGSGKQLAHILYGVMGLKQEKKTDSGEDSTDKEALLSLGVPDLAPYFRMKLLEKALTTYISQIAREVHDNVIHPTINLHIPVSFRSSMSDPNLQNVPIRNKDIGIIIRGAYKPRDKKNGVLVEADLKGAEVSTAACYNHDPKFISYVENPANDMHKDTMGLILEAPTAQVTKELRHVSKNKFVFPEFYGDYFGSCAKSIWAEIQKLSMVDGTPALIWLKQADIIKLPNGWKQGQYIHYAKQNGELNPIFAGFLDHMEKVEHKFWYEMFPVYTEWKEETWQQYLHDGYADSFTGFRYTGIMDKKKVINYKIQGTAYHLNQEGINYVSKVLREQGAYTRAVNQIHDSGIYDSCEDEYKDLIGLINHTMNVRLPRRHSWINVPIIVEFEVCPRSEAWFYKKPFDLNSLTGVGRFVTTQKKG